MISIQPGNELTSIEWTFRNYFKVILSFISMSIVLSPLPLRSTLKTQISDSSQSTHTSMRSHLDKNTKGQFTVTSVLIPWKTPSSSMKRMRSVTTSMRYKESSKWSAGSAQPGFACGASFLQNSGMKSLVARLDMSLRNWKAGLRNIGRSRKSALSSATTVAR